MYLNQYLKFFLIPLRLTAEVSATDAAIQKKRFALDMTTLIISNDEMNDIMKIIKSLEDAGLLMKDVSETIENEAKEQKVRFLDMLLGTLGGSFLGNLLTGKKVRQSNIPGRGVMISDEGTIRAGESTVRASERTVRADQDF